ncbi:MAG: hypothetical protein PVG13_08565 [Thiohalophilus sp.]|jgi:hypothetical protein
MTLLKYYLVKEWWNIAVAVFLIVMGYLIYKKNVLWDIRLHGDQGMIAGGVIAGIGVLFLVGSLMRGYKKAGKGQ